MKHLSINTAKTQNDSAINNGFSFPDYSGSTNIVYSATSTSFRENEIAYPNAEPLNLYTICTDWIEFICVYKEPIELLSVNNQNPDIVIKKINVHHNPNFCNLHRIYYNTVEACDIYSCPNNSTHSFNEVSVKITNVLLYMENYDSIINNLMIELGLSFKRMARIDIAVDGETNEKIIYWLNKLSKSKTVQFNNKAISLSASELNKDIERWEYFLIGKGKSGISARVYNKTKEVMQKRKIYITDYWVKNHIAHQNVWRFEIQLNYKKLRKYHIEWSDFKHLKDAEFVGAIFTSEVKSWLRLYHVRKKDMQNHKKEIAIKHGKEIQLLKWEKLPAKMEMLQFDTYIPNSSYINARNAVSFALHEILLRPDTSTTAQVDIIRKYANDYQLQDYVNTKIKMWFGSEIKKQYIQILKSLVFDSVRDGNQENNNFN